MMPKAFLASDLQREHSVQIVRMNDLRARLITLQRRVERQAVSIAALQGAVRRMRERTNQQSVDVLRMQLAQLQRRIATLSARQEQLERDQRAHVQAGCTPAR